MKEDSHTFMHTCTHTTHTHKHMHTWHTDIKRKGCHESVFM